jgi:endonuclease/exonuclease/phosphatase family metal-dependent hydrolase
MSFRHGLLCATILAGGSGFAAAAPDADGADHAAACEAISVVTLNVYHDQDDWPARRPLVIEGLKALAPDVVVLQEVLQHETLRNQAEDIADALGYGWWFVSADPPEQARRYGNAILTPHPVVARSGHRLRPLKYFRTLAHARIEVRGRKLDVYGTHLHHTPEGEGIRARQVRHLLSIVAKGEGTVPSLLLGDFNAPVTARELEPLLERYVDVFGAFDETADAITTLNPHYFERQARIDHVFAERGRFEILEAWRVLDEPDASGTWPSDHFGVYARLCFARDAG